MSPWEVFTAARRNQFSGLRNLVSVRKDCLGISGDLAVKYFDGETHAAVLVDEVMGLFAIKACRSTDLGAYKLNKRESMVLLSCQALNMKYVLKRGHYSAEWDSDIEALVFKPDKAENVNSVPIQAPVVAPDTEPCPMPENVDPSGCCPVCGAPGYHQGECPSCGFDEAEGLECPLGCVRPLEKLETCKGCDLYKRRYGGNPAVCRFTGWLGDVDSGTQLITQEVQQ